MRLAIGDASLAIEHNPTEKKLSKNLRNHQVTYTAEQHKR